MSLHKHNSRLPSPVAGNSHSDYSSTSAYPTKSDYSSKSEYPPTKGFGHETSFQNSSFIIENSFEAPASLQNSLIMQSEEEFEELEIMSIDEKKREEKKQ